MLEKPGIPGTLSHSWLMDGYYPTYGKPIRWCPPVKCLLVFYMPCIVINLSTAKHSYIKPSANMYKPTKPS